MAMNEYDAVRELARIHLLLRRSLQDMKCAEDGNPITDIDLTAAEFELCNGKPHKDTSFKYSRRRQLKYAMRMIESWYDGAVNTGEDDGSEQPPDKDDWANLGEVMTQFYNDTNYVSDGEDLDEIDGEDSEPGEVKRDHEEELYDEEGEGEEEQEEQEEEEEEGEDDEYKQEEEEEDEEEEGEEGEEEDEEANDKEDDEDEKDREEKEDEEEEKGVAQCATKDEEEEPLINRMMHKRAKGDKDSAGDSPAKKKMKRPSKAQGPSK